MCVAALVATGAGGCKNDGRAPPAPARREGNPMTVQTDLQKLRMRVSLPPGDFPCRFVTVPVVEGGGAFLPGPTDTQTYAFVVLDEQGWDQLATPGSQPAPKTVTLRAAVARAILPAAAIAGVREDDQGRIAITGSAVPREPLDRSSQRVTFAIKVASGLLVGLHST
jgi:hypothetical protein